MSFFRNSKHQISVRKELKLFLLLSFFTIINSLQAQQKDSAGAIRLHEVLIREVKPLGGIERMPDVRGNVIYAGKKTEVIKTDEINADLSTNNTRQVFGKVPGMSIWENDGSGIQVGVATRGLSPNRSWEFNVRQNGYDITPDVFGYPESYYTPPMEAIERIEVIRGAASLQFGPQFAGILNYQIKKPDPEKPFTFQTFQTIGSYGLFNMFNAAGGTFKKFSYYGYFHHRNAEGWRANSRYSINTGYLSFQYRFSEKLTVNAEYTGMNYKSQQSGGLTDANFKENHRQSFRERNWFGTPWNVASATVRYETDSTFSIQVKTFTTIAERNSVGFTKSINIADTINALTGKYNPRQVDRDNYTNYGLEARMVLRYRFYGGENVLSAGVRAYHGTVRRNKLGVGSTGSYFDLTLSNPQYGSSLNFSTDNYAVFAEHIFQLGKRLKIIPGFRLDFIRNNEDGYIDKTSAGFISPQSRNRQIFLYGAGSEFQLTEKTMFYGNYALAYRPVTFSELTPAATTETVDPDLKDASGFNADLGYRGAILQILNFDLGLFYLHYDNRIGTVIKNGAQFKTNIGTSVSKGIESYVELDVFKLLYPGAREGSVSLFASNSLLHARYVRWDNPAISNDPGKSIKDKKVENAPEYIHRYGLTISFKGFSSTFQLNSVGGVYTDAANTEKSNATGTVGKIDAYRLADFSLSYRFEGGYQVKAGVNNLTDEAYATRRSAGYPGPGLLPGNGRTFYLTLGASF